MLKKEDVVEDLRCAGFENVNPAMIQINFNMIDDFYDIVLVAEDQSVYRCIYDVLSNKQSRYRQIQKSRKEITEVK